MRAGAGLGERDGGRADGMEEGPAALRRVEGTQKLLEMGGGQGEGRIELSHRQIELS